MCEFYNETMCIESQQGCLGTEECVAQNPDKRNHCYVLWTIDNVTKKTVIKLKVSYFINFSSCMGDLLYTFCKFCKKFSVKKDINEYICQYIHVYCLFSGLLSR